MRGDMPAAERAKALHDAAGKARKKLHDIQALGSALLHVLGDIEGRDHEPLTTAIALGGMIETQAAKQANKIDLISLGLSALCEDLKRETAAS